MKVLIVYVCYVIKYELKYQISNDFNLLKFGHLFKKKENV